MKPPYRWTIEDTRDKTGIKRKVYWRLVFNDLFFPGILILSLLGLFFYLVIYKHN